MLETFLACVVVVLLVTTVSIADDADPAPVDVLKQLGWDPSATRQTDAQGRLDAASRAPDKPVRLTLLDAIRYSLEGNQDIEVVSYTPRQSAAEIESAESVFDTSVFADTSFRREPNLQSSVTEIVMEDTGVFQTGIRKPLTTGGSLSTFLEMRYGDLINSEFDRTYRYIFAPTVEVRQPILKNFGSRQEKAAIKIAKHQARISDEQLRQKVIEVATRVSKVYWQLYLFGELVKINRQNLEMAEEVLRRETVRLAQGISQQIDVERASSNAQARRSTLLQSRQRFESAMDQLKLLINSPTLTIDSGVQIIPIEAPQTASIQVDQTRIIESALNHRPEIISAIQKLRIRQVEENLTAHKRLPNLDVFGRYSLSGYGTEFNQAVSDTGVDDNDAWAVGLNFEWPIGNRSAKSSYRKKQLEREQAVAQVKRIGNQIKLDVKQVLLAIAYAGGEIDSTRQAKAAAEKVVTGEFARFDIGQKTNEELLRAQDLLAAASRNYVRAVVDYNISMAELDRAQGILPEQIAIEDHLK